MACSRSERKDVLKQLDTQTVRADDRHSANLGLGERGAKLIFSHFPVYRHQKRLCVNIGESKGMYDFLAESHSPFHFELTLTSFTLHL